jgi:GMP synthase (glutamine-hydrolysing)
MKRVLVVRTGSAPPSLLAAHGDFTDWFAALLAPGAGAEVVDGEGPLPEARAYGGLLVTGSLASLTRPEPWMDRLGAWLLAAAEELPVLGVCFGHQLLASALGARVERNAEGPEAGTVEIVLTAAGRADPLFTGSPTSLLVQQSHEDHVPVPPAGAIVLAGNGHSPVQAFAHGARLRAVQFHPELDAPRTRAMIEADREWLDGERPGLADAAIAGIRETPEAERLLASWVRAYVRP